MRAWFPVLLAACAPPTPSAGDPAALARVGAAPALVELRVNADVVDDPAWTAAIDDAADAATACLALPSDRVLHRYARIPLLHAALTPDQVQRAAACPTVARVGPDGEDHASVEVVLDVIDAAEGWAAVDADGAGVAIGVVDSGANVGEPDLDGRIVASYDHAENDDDVADCSGHGSNVAAIAGAVAPGADLLVHKVFSAARNECRTSLHSDTAKALDALLGQRAAFGLTVVNLSLASSARYAAACDDEVVAYTAGIRALVDAGVVVVASVGNSGDPDAASYPSCLTTTIAVANSVKEPIDDLVTDDIWRNSNGGPVVDLAAPGTRVTAGGSTRTGSSMSSPAVAGAVAVLRSVDGTLSPEAVRERATRSRFEVVDARGAEVRRFPRLDLPTMLEAALAAAAPIVDDGAGGDGDGRLENGEAAAVGFTASSVGRWAGVTARLGCADDALEVAGDAIPLGDLDGPIDTSALGVAFAVAAGPTCDERVVACTVVLADADGVSRRLALPLPVPCQDDVDGDGYPAAEDCDDADPLVHPDAEERCNGEDDDCDDAIDEGLLAPWAPDADGDGFGGLDTVQACATPGAGWAPVAERPADDCDDADPSVHPGAAETCDGRDQDCDDAIDEEAGELWWSDGDGDGFGAGTPIQACDAPDGHVARDGDCDDADGEVFPDEDGACPPPGGCGCDASGATGLGLFLLAPLVLARRRAARRGAR